MPAPSASAEPMLDLIPHLRTFARGLVADAAAADDLVRGALLEWLASLDPVISGEALRARLAAILRDRAALAAAWPAAARPRRGRDRPPAAGGGRRATLMRISPGRSARA